MPERVLGSIPDEISGKITRTILEVFHEISGEKFRINLWNSRTWVSEGFSGVS